MQTAQRHFVELSSRVSVYAVGVALPILVTLVGARLALPAFVFEHLMVVLVVGLAVAGGQAPAITAAIVGAIADNVLLREPVGRPAITGVRDAVDLGLFLVVALVVGWLVDRLRNEKARALEAAERERLARQALDRVVATVAHDLATPLNAIQGTIQFARRRTPLSDIDAARLLGRVETAAARATSLLRLLADAKSIEGNSFSLELRRIDFRAVVEPIARMLGCLSDRHPIALVLDATPVWIQGDADRLGRVVENLITNAIKYSPDGGHVDVQLQRHTDGAVLTVRDHGIGVSFEARARMFELGYRAPEATRVAPGLGLGLYTTAEVIRRHEGVIDADVAPGGGTVFTVRIPLVRSPMSSVASAPMREIAADSPSSGPTLGLPARSRT